MPQRNVPQQGYTGKTCSDDVNECQSNPCHNGTCQTKVNGYSCSHTQNVLLGIHSSGITFRSLKLNTLSTDLISNFPIRFRLNGFREIRLRDSHTQNVLLDIHSSGITFRSLKPNSLCIDLIGSFPIRLCLNAFRQILFGIPGKVVIDVFSSVHNPTCTILP
nr:hypothetical protein BaRGS_027700 [Batillaria attramentaria]